MDSNNNTLQNNEEVKLLNELQHSFELKLPDNFTDDIMKKISAKSALLSRVNPKIKTGLIILYFVLSICFSFLLVFLLKIIGLIDFDIVNWVSSTIESGYSSLNVSKNITTVNQFINSGFGATFNYLTSIFHNTFSSVLTLLSQTLTTVKIFTSQNSLFIMIILDIAILLFFYHLLITTNNKRISSR
ncbi:MAG: hypothetical protein WC140_06190 [Bacteroidales bacterium]